MKHKQVIEQLLGKARVRINGMEPGDILVHNDKFYGRVLAEGSLGLGESYMDGWWDAGRLDEFFSKFHSVPLDQAVVDKHLVINALKARLFNMQNKRLSKRVAQQHYDLDSAFYEKMLGPRMQYTCAYWKRAQDLEAAQEHKLDLICRKLRLQKGDRVLELGCGWGGFAHYAATTYGCHVTAYNISAQQVAYARQWCKGLPVEIVHGDYREARGEFDKVAAIGLCEHVGYKNYRTLMQTIHRSLKRRGLCLVHTIGNNASVSTADPWFDKYIFPGGMLPSVAQLSAAMDDLLVMEDWHNFGPDYDRTLVAWQDNVDRHWEELKTSFDERFYRTWRYYLLSLAGAFRARRIHLWQIVMSKQGVLGGYEPVR
ncbi:cyclopropane-fatty-acyl-phospholipid synthase [Nitrospira sp. KM1]|uniref:cyclopropane fatty acyl phospholipid synthase n=1 Tax=Nitrospira sp. KM1 TaxID=1936990 RepID=UPI0013A718EA|nr:cyclopropane fatty acyl phospholipid synthase [Nitrospira sp. KM1]BCA55787.1 cyclopropane-fatty-acyl-phospholipid synthase [Nitrospira sp. KM1]